MELAGFMVLALCFGLVAVGCYRVGLRDGARLGGKAELPQGRPWAPARGRTVKKSREQAQEERRISRVIENIDNYNGSPLGQKDVV